jgi:hypothetical protein
MARKIAVLDYHQKSGDSPNSYITKQEAKGLEVRLLAEWVIVGLLLKMLPPKQGLSRLAYYGQVAQSTRDAILPSCELKGLKFMLRTKNGWNGAPAQEWLDQHLSQ